MHRPAAPVPSLMASLWPISVRFLLRSLRRSGVATRERGSTRTPATSPALFLSTAVLRPDAFRPNALRPNVFRPNVFRPIVFRPIVFCPNIQPLSFCSSPSCCGHKACFDLSGGPFSIRSEKPRRVKASNALLSTRCFHVRSNRHLQLRHMFSAYLAPMLPFHSAKPRRVRARTSPRPRSAWPRTRAPP
ncbi:unnamed protein product, partial [Ectocarpus sp. 12 AP-2014]